MTWPWAFGTRSARPLCSTSPAEPALSARTAAHLPVAYPDRAADILVHFTDNTLWQRTWIARHILGENVGRSRGRSPASPRSRASESSTAQYAFPELWRRSPRPLFGLLERARSDAVRTFAIDLLKTDFRAVLREVEPAWVARLVLVQSKALDEFVVWILGNVPRFEQAAFRSLGLHDTVLRLFDSPSFEAQTYAAGYARTYAARSPGGRVGPPDR